VQNAKLRGWWAEMGKLCPPNLCDFAYTTFLALLEREGEPLAVGGFIFLTFMLYVPFIRLSLMPLGTSFCRL